MSRFAPKRYRSAINSARHRQANWDSVGFGVPVSKVDEFLKTTDLTKRSKAIDKIEKIRLRNAALLVGLMSVEMAHNVDSDDATEWLDRGKANLKKVALREITSHPDLNAAIAQQTLDMMPHFTSLCIKGELPSREWLQTMYADSQQTAQRTLAGFEYHGGLRDEEEYHETAASDLSGLMAEQAVALLGLRFVLQKLDGGGWVMAPSLFSENHVPFNYGGPQRSNWDLSVHTKPNNDPTYKIQVKSAESANRKGKIYTDDIVVLNVKEDLGFSSDRGQNVAANIIRELCVEPGNQLARSKIETRTDMLL